MFDITKTKAVLWDLDDTLYSRVNAARQTFYGMFRENFYPDKSDEFIEQAVNFMMSQAKRNNMIHNDAFHALLEKYPGSKPYIRSNCLDYYFGHISDFAEPFPEQIEVIKKLRESGVKTALVTNVTSERIYCQKKKIEVLGIESLFDCIVLSGELGIHKPDRRIFDYTAKLLGVSNEECVFVGDDPDSDISGALNADMEAVWIDREEYDGTFAGEPRVYRVKSVYEYFNF